MPSSKPETTSISTMFVYLTVKWIRTSIITCTATEFFLTLLLPLCSLTYFNFGQILTNAAMSVLVYGPINEGVREGIEQFQTDYSKNPKNGTLRLIAPSIAALLRCFIFRLLLSEITVYSFLFKTILVLSIIDNITIFTYVTTTTSPAPQRKTEIPNRFLWLGEALSLEKPRPRKWTFRHDDPLMGGYSF